MGVEVKTSSELDRMREAARIVALTLDELEKAAQPGTTLNELDRIAQDCIRKYKATSSFLGYHGYPKVLCASPNEVVVHGIPDGRKLAEGDIVGLDFGVSLKGFHGDAARTVAVGKVSAEAQRLIDTTREALERGIALAQPGQRVSDIGHAVQSHVEAAGFSVVRDFVGHGIGRRMHEEPQVPNYGQPGRGLRLRPGMVLAIEPMVNVGTHEVELMPDQWTVLTKDRKWSAHFEHTVAVTEAGPEVLTVVR